jgi:hypothetical protein
MYSINAAIMFLKFDEGQVRCFTFSYTHFQARLIFSPLNSLLAIRITLDSISEFAVILYVLINLLLGRLANSFFSLLSLCGCSSG